MLPQNRHDRSNALSILSSVLIFALWECILFVPLCQAQSPCENVVARAERLYEAGRVTNAVALLRPCLPDSIMETQQVRAWEILALAYIAEDYITEAERAVENLIGQNPDYQPDPDRDPQSFVELVRKVKKQLEKRLVKLIKVNFGYPFFLPNDNVTNSINQSTAFIVGLEIMFGQKLLCGFSFDYNRFPQELQIITGADNPTQLGIFEGKQTGQLYSLALMYKYKSNLLPKRWEGESFFALKIGLLKRKFDVGIDEFSTFKDDNRLAQTFIIGIEIPLKSSIHLSVSFDYFGTTKSKVESLNTIFNYSKSYLAGSLKTIIYF